MADLWQELRRRNVFRVGLAYLAGVWLLLQVADTVLSNFDSPTWIIQALIFASALGFPVVLILAWLFELTPEGVVAEADLQAHKTVKFTGRRIDFAIIGLLVLAVGFLVSGNLLVDRPEIFADGEQPSIAVLPFVNMSSDSEQEYFSDGISEELLNLLAQVPNFRVISRSSSFAFKGQAIDIPTVAEQLNVHHVLEGSVRKSGDYVRITVQLIDARSDTNLWSETYDRTLENIFAVQDEIAASVLEQLQITLLGASPHRNEIETEAYTLLLRARYILNERLQESYPVADAALREALEIDPDFADAMIELGRLRHSEGSRGIRPQEEGIRLASELMEEALNVEPDNGHAYAWLGFLSRRYDDDIAAAAKYTERALALDPTNTEILGGVIGMLKVLDHLDESIVIGEYVVTHDPLCDDCYYGLSASYRDAMRLDEAEAVLRTGLALRPERPQYQSLGLILLLKGEAEAALAEFQQIDENDPDRSTYMALALHDLGRQAEFETEFSELRDQFGEPLSIAQVYAYVGEVDAAFEWLDRVFEDRTGRNPLSYAHRPTLRSLHADPRWQVFLERMGIAPEQLAALDFKVTLPE